MCAHALVCLSSVNSRLQLDGQSQPENRTGSLGQVNFWVTVLRAGAPPPPPHHLQVKGSVEGLRSSLVAGAHVGDFRAGTDRKSSITVV